MGERQLVMCVKHTRVGKKQANIVFSTGPDSALVRFATDSAFMKMVILPLPLPYGTLFPPTDSRKQPSYL